MAYQNNVGVKGEANSKKCRSTACQREELVSLMETNLSLARGKFTGPMSHQTNEKMWGDVARRLSEIGPPKTAVQAKTMWRDMKLSARKKNAELQKAHSATGNRTKVFPLSDLIKKILFIIGTETSEGIDDDGFGETFIEGQTRHTPVPNPIAVVSKPMVPEPVLVQSPASSTSTNYLWEEIFIEETIKKEIPEEETPQEKNPIEETIKKETPEEETPKEENPKEENPKEDNPKEENPKEDNPKEETPREDTTLKQRRKTNEPITKRRRVDDFHEIAQQYATNQQKNINVLKEISDSLKSIARALDKNNELRARRNQIEEEKLKIKNIQLNAQMDRRDD